MNLITRMYKESVIQSEDKSAQINHYLYFVFANDCIKIGITNCIYNRMQHYKTSNPCDVILIADLTLPNKEVAEILEDKIHSHFEKYRIKGEWFTASDEILKFAKDMREFEKRLYEKAAKKSSNRWEHRFKGIIVT